MSTRLPRVVLPDGHGFDLEQVVEWERQDGDLILVMPFAGVPVETADSVDSQFVSSGPYLIVIEVGPVADWVEGVLRQFSRTYPN